MAMKNSLGYPRYKPRRLRPFGMGAFFDYAVAVAGLYAGKLPSCSLHHRAAEARARDAMSRA
jgi:hypothetical protein